MSKAFLKNYRQSPRKVRIVADLVRGKKVNDAINLLKFTPKRTALVLKKVVESAGANAVNNHQMNGDELFIKEIRVDEGATLKRWMPRARGSAATIRRRTSHISVVLDSKAVLNKPKKITKTKKDVNLDIKEVKKPIRKKNK